jgi:hypothetical protein
MSTRPPSPVAALGKSCAVSTPRAARSRSGWRRAKRVVQRARRIAAAKGLVIVARPCTAKMKVSAIGFPALVRSGPESSLGWAMTARRVEPAWPRPAP